MNDEHHGQLMFPAWLIRKPLSSLTTALAGILILMAVYQLYLGRVYLDLLNWVDWTTLIMVAVLLLRGIYCLRFDTDLQAISLALISALSFVFMFEAIYKLSFYAFPWRMPPGELREFVIQVGTALTVLVGFAYSKFRISCLSLVFLGIFIAAWIFWLLIGFPQLDSGTNIFPSLLKIDLTHEMIYTLNRITKLALCLGYCFFYKAS